jgi:hypothetical protein
MRAIAAVSSTTYRCALSNEEVVMTIKGMEGLTKTIDDAKKALEGLDGQFGNVSFDPTDPASIEAAIKSMEAMVDERLGQFASNPIIGPLTSQMKEKYREAIIERAATARLKKSEE